MFGATKKKIGKRIYYIQLRDGCQYVFDAKGKQLLYFMQDNSLCSLTIIKYFSLSYGLTKTDENFIKLIVPAIFKNSMVLTVQNTTKSTFKKLIEYGFIDYARLPGKYTEDDTDPTNRCLSLMVFSSKPLVSSIKKSLALLKVLANGETL